MDRDAALAQFAAARVRDAGLRTVRTKNMADFLAAASIVIYRPGFEAEAAQLRAALGGEVVQMYAVDDLPKDIQVRVVVGTEVKNQAAKGSARNS